MVSEPGPVYLDSNRYVSIISFIREVERSNLRDFSDFNLIHDSALRLFVLSGRLTQRMTRPQRALFTFTARPELAWQTPLSLSLSNTNTHWHLSVIVVYCNRKQRTKDLFDIYLEWCAYLVTNPGINYTKCFNPDLVAWFEYAPNKLALSNKHLWD